jgi:hypothetical protein
MQRVLSVGACSVQLHRARLLLRSLSKEILQLEVRDPDFSSQEDVHLDTVSDSLQYRNGIKQTSK